MHIDGFNITSSQVWFQTQFVASLRHTSIWPGTIFLAHTRSVVAAFFLPAPRNKRIKNPKYMSFSTVVASHHQALADEPPNPCSVDHGPPASPQNGTCSDWLAIRDYVLQPYFSLGVLCDTAWEIRTRSNSEADATQPTPQPETPTSSTTQPNRLVARSGQTSWKMPFFYFRSEQANFQGVQKSRDVATPPSQWSRGRSRVKSH